MKRILMMIMCVVMAISLFGCGQSNEQKYMSLRNEVETEMKAYDKIVTAIPDHHGKSKYGPQYAVGKEEFRERFLAYHEKALPEIVAIQKKVMPKLEEMEKLAKDDLKLKKDFEDFGIKSATLLKYAIDEEAKIINGTDDLSKSLKRKGYDPNQKHSLFTD